MAATTVYNAGYAMEIASNTLPEIMFWVRFQHWGIQVIAPSWLLFSLCLAGQEKLITPKRIAALYILPIILFLTAQTLGTSNLMHLNPGLNTTGPFPTFIYERGLWAWVSTVYIAACLIVSTTLFLIMLFTALPAFRTQAVVLLTGSLIPWFGNIVYIFNLTPYNLDFAPLALSFSGLFLAAGVLRFHLLDIVPLARDVIFEGMRDGVLVLDLSNRIIDFNPRLPEMLPGIGKTSVGKPTREILAPYPILLDLIKEDVARQVDLQVNRAGALYSYQSTLSFLFDSRQRAVGKIVTLHDDTQVKQLLGQLEDLAKLDDLTGVNNRRYFNELANRELYRLQRYGSALSFILLDLDHFKRINDTYGHPAGDAALQIVARTCREMLRLSDIVGRYGGEEFIILLPETEPAAATRVAQKLRLALEQQRIQYEEHSFGVTASFGVAGVVSSGNISLEELFRCADRAVYEAKETGRNRVCTYDPST